VVPHRIGHDTAVPEGIIHWEPRHGKPVHIFQDIVLDTRPWEMQWTRN